MSEGNATKNLVVALDFDGVVVTNRFPEIGRPIGAALWLKECELAFQPKVILWTCRSNEQPYLEQAPEGILRVTGPHLDQALEECRRQGIKLWAVNGNPQQASWTTSSKLFADVYIDDHALGIPMVKLHGEPKPCVNWNLAGPKLHTLCHDAMYPKTVKGIDPANMA